MPNYSYGCDNCNKVVELFFYIKDYDDQPLCNECKNKMHRLYSLDVLTQAASVRKADSELKTIGDLARRNTDKMSEDEKAHLHHKHNSYKEQQPVKTLPNGMSRMKKPPKTQWR